MNRYSAHSDVPLPGRNCLVVRQRCQTGAKFAGSCSRLRNLPEDLRPRRVDSAVARGAVFAASEGRAPLNTAFPGPESPGGDDFDRSAVLGLVADVGGTHIRFGIAVGGATSGPLGVHCVRRYAVRAHESIAHAAHHYRSATPGVPAALNRAAVAVAGRVDADRVQLTNSAWSF